MFARTIIRLVMLVALLSGCAGQPGPTGIAGDAEFMDAAAARAELEAALKDVPVPPGASISPKIPDESASYEVGFGRQTVEAAAMCAWLRYWLDAISADQAGDVDKATAIADHFSTWTIYLHADQSYRDVIDKLVSNAKLGDPSAMSDFVLGNCRPA